MLKAVRKHLLSREYTILADERPVARSLAVLNWTRDTLELQGEVYRLYWYSERGGLWGRVRYAMEGKRTLLATSEEPQHPRFRVTARESESEYLLRVPSFFTISKFDVFSRDARIGRIHADNWRQSAMTIDLPADVSFPTQMFMLWLVLHVSNSVSSIQMMSMHSYGKLPRERINAHGL
jgi:hypothetical protein